ncbi:MAG TPA: isoprenylcysteine carboxylmethyltransferase family protein [Smithella sp.]|nr:isoprenylcysteine carboxylmethyltransferase family protein [Smithella sp.]HQO14545.1 isoprenylcysteine carboxylmethyltransferase family protein [Smithellaceae bacterium]HNY49956.1 isoprenylcysteine carboxylmethyltransferase family protein [Smithella sp.]HOG90484.1 isoprenylcysteine carboxylmethyltransferase family protein [Smithella sp.]HOU51647.1 isoprenylcysteine carboxylmethyltransferase family protein [Smithella sp.]
MIEKLRLILSKIFVGFLFVLVIFASSLWEDKAPFVTSLLFFLGAILVGIASMGRLWCSVYIAGYKTGHLVTQGPYSMCRNPLYFFSLVGGLGVGFASETLLIPLLILIAFVAYYPFVIKSEEAELIVKHKSEFENYLKSVPMFFPNTSLLKEPEEYIVKPRIFRQHMFDTLLFIWLLGALVVIKELHELKIIPTLFKIY